MTEELYIDGAAVDLKPNAATTLNYKSNLLGDVSKITSSNSQTIRCPKTTRNRRIFDNPGAPAYVSGKRYKRYSARLVRNGIEVVSIGYAVLLSSSGEYEIALYWGVMANFQAWVDRGARLDELEGDEALAWNKSVAATALTTMKSDGYGYARYDCGVSNTDLVNYHPSATAWWVLGKIAAQAGFAFDVPERYKEALRSMAIPCLQRNPSPESWEAEKTTALAHCTTIREFVGAGGGIGGNPMGYITGYINVKSSTQVNPVFIGNNVAYNYYASYRTNDIGWPYGTDPRTVKMAEFSTLLLEEMEIYIDALSVNSDTYTAIVMYVKKDGATYAEFKKWEMKQGQTIREIIDCSGFDKYYFILRSPLQEAATYVIDIEIMPHASEMSYPSAFRISANLPEISQVDFIKAICGMLGIFVVPDPADAKKLKFVSLDAMQENKARAKDWSDKLVASGDDEPKTVELKINDYCRNNYFKYKEDDTVTANADGNLKVGSELLEAEKTVVTLPFAASDGSKIPHYRLNDAGTEVDAVQVKDRIMRLTDDAGGRAALTFDGLEFPTLLSIYYSTLSRMLDNALMVTERIALNEYDLKTLDYSIPFYLRQYGKYYAVVSIQSTADKACEVKAVQLPSDAVVAAVVPAEEKAVGEVTENMQPVSE